MAVDEREFDELPDGWVSTTIDSVTAKVPNYDPKKEPQRIFGYVDISSIDNNAYRIVDPKYFSGKDAPSRAKRPVKTDDVLFSNVRTYLKNIAMVPPELNVQLCSTGFTVLRSAKTIEPKLLFYFVISDCFISYVTPQQTGSSYPATNDGVVRSAEIPLPLLAEQKRIVAKVDELLSRVNAARERLDRVPAILKRFRQSVLAAACSGRLTDDWREQNPDTESASELLERIRTERRRQWEQAELAKMKAKGKKPKDNKWKAKYKEPAPVDASELPELPDGWVTVPLNVACSMIGDGTHFSPINTPQGDFLYITAKNIRPWGVDLSNVTYVSKDVHKEIYSRCPVEKGDVLYIKDGATTGLAVVNHLEQEFSMLSSVALLKPERIALNAFFLKHWLNCPKTHKMMTGQMSGSAITRLVLKTIRAVEMPLPPLAEQHEIVRRVESLFALADEIERQVARGTRRVETITQSVLAKAFRGELVPTEAELARAEGRAYEPASALLERIKAERNVAKPKRARRTAKKSTEGGTSKRGVNYRRAAYAAAIVQRFSEDSTFGRIKLNKIILLANRHLNLGMQFEPKREALGPSDDKALYNLESLAGKNEFFKKGKREHAEGYRYFPGKNITHALNYVNGNLGDKTEKWENFLTLFTKLNTERCEIVATIYFAWSDLITTKTEINDDEIIREVRVNWHESKQRFSPERLLKAITWMREKKLIPPMADND